MKTLTRYLTKTHYELCHDKTCLRGFRPGPTQIGLYSHRIWLEARNFGFRKRWDCTISVRKTKALISCTADLRLCICICEKEFFL